MQTMYDRLGSLLSEALEKGELPKTNEDSPRSSDFFESPAQNRSSEQADSATKPKIKVFTFRSTTNSNQQKQKISPQKKPDYQVIKNFIPEQVKSALAFIQIPETASYEEAKKIYREKLMYYHPDRRADNPVLQKVAKEKTARLLKEWQLIENWYESN